MDDVYTHSASAQDIAIEYGRYSELVNSKHKRAYGAEGATSIADQIGRASCRERV